MFPLLTRSLLNSYDYDLFNVFQNESIASNYNIISDDSSYKLAFELAGYKKEDIDVDLDGKHLTIKATRSHEILGDATFNRKFSIGSNVDIENISVSFSEGVLSINIPRVTETENVRKIEIS